MLIRRPGRSDLGLRFPRADLSESLHCKFHKRNYADLTDADDKIPRTAPELYYRKI